MSDYFGLLFLTLKKKNYTKILNTEYENEIARENQNLYQNWTKNIVKNFIIVEIKQN